jgi:peptidoglycan/LPS O-acetylase OafA/YrhL
LRLRELDSLRGIAAFAVILFHYYYRYPKIFNVENSLDIFYFGQYGVHLFFIISGFVISHSIVNLNSPVKFLKKRFLRLYPTYWICMTITYLIVTFFGLPGREVAFVEWIGNFLMVQSLFGIKSVDGVYWSLTVEVLFYCLISILIIKAFRKYSDILVFLWIGAIFINTVYKIPYFDVLLNLKYGPYFIAGIIFSKLYYDQQYNIKNYIVLFLSILCAFIIDSTLIGCFIISILYCLFFLLTRNKLKPLDNNLLVFMGSISYPLYLIHQNIGYVILSYIKINTDILFVKYSYYLIPILPVVAISYLIHVYCEIPIQRIFRPILIREK